MPFDQLNRRKFTLLGGAAETTFGRVGTRHIPKFLSTSSMRQKRKPSLPPLNGAWE
jgi:hypothetical protein